MFKKRKVNTHTNSLTLLSDIILQSTYKYIKTTGDGLNNISLRYLPQKKSVTPPYNTHNCIGLTQITNKLIIHITVACHHFMRILHTVAAWP